MTKLTPPKISSIDLCLENSLKCTDKLFIFSAIELTILAVGTIKNVALINISHAKTSNAILFLFLSFG